MRLIFSFLLVLLTSACSSGEAKKQSSINKLSVEKELQKGKTTQAQVLEKFGSPNTVSSNERGEEVWGYSRSSSQYDSKSVGASVWDGITGWTGFGYLSGGASKSQESTQTASLIVYFNKVKVVTNYTYQTEIY